MSKLLNALHCENREAPPIWLMRQAGRYMPQYQALRKNHALLDMFHDTEMIVRVTKLPLDLLEVDAAILFSDILTVLDGMGKKYDFKEGVGPVVEKPVEPGETFELTTPYEPIMRAIRELKGEISVPLLGFAGAPFTIASYLIEGGSSRDLRKTKQWIFRDPKSFHDLLETITTATIAYLKEQIEAGVDAIQLFDSWANTLGIHQFREFSLRYMQKVMQALPQVPVILFCRGSCYFAQDLASLSPECISLDWSGDITTFRSRLPSTIALQGNLDPSILYASKETIRKEADRLLCGMRDDPGYIFNLGHGILPDIPFENVRFLVDHVKNHARLSH